MKAGVKEKIKYTLNYIVYTCLEAVLLMFKFIGDEFKKKGGD